MRKKLASKQNNELPRTWETSRKPLYYQGFCVILNIEIQPEWVKPTPLFCEKGALYGSNFKNQSIGNTDFR